jgi:hypothetical protein
MSGISSATKEEFLRVLKQEYGIDVSLAQSTEVLETLVGYYDLLARMYHREKIKTDDDHNNDNQRIS